MKTIKINETIEIPALGFGVFQIPQEQTKDAVVNAIQAGYRHIDTAQSYMNETEVGEGIKASGIDRSELFVTTKVWIENVNMVYGKNVPGNFMKLIKVASLLPVFPKINNERSVLYIDTLCQHIQHLMNIRFNTITHPQNESYMATNQALSFIREELGKKINIIEIPIPRLILKYLSQNRAMNKIYGNLTYTMDIDDELVATHTKPFKQTIHETVNK